MIVPHHHATFAFALPPRALAARLTAIVMLAASAPVRFLVTGGTGFIGRRLVAHLARRHGATSIACLVHQTAGSSHAERAAASEQLAAGVRVIEGDLTRPTVANEAPPAPEVVFHLAANIDTEATETDARVNDEGTANLLRWLGDRLAGRRVMFASSVAVCDRRGPADGPLDETSPHHPRTAYGRTKLRGERIVVDETTARGGAYTILRFPTVYGEGQKAGGMFDLLRRYAAERAWLGRLNWPGRTSILHVDDAARIMIDVATLPEAANEVFCVASGDEMTVGEIARRIGGLTGHPIAPIDLPPAFWRVVRWIAWNRAIAAIVPPFARVSHWRLGLIADDGFWQSAAKLRGVYPRPLLRLEEGLGETQDAATPDVDVSLNARA